jgi:DNA-binding transcriptional ArsR family regulator
MMIMAESLNLDAAFSALADPTRRAILARLAKGEATVMELAGPFAMTQPAISQHLKVLEEAGLVASRVDGTKRPRRLAKAGIEAMDQWLAMLRDALERSYDRLDEVLAGMETQKRSTSETPDRHATGTASNTGSELAKRIRTEERRRKNKQVQKRKRGERR